MDDMLVMGTKQNTEKNWTVATPNDNIQEHRHVNRRVQINDSEMFRVAAWAGERVEEGTSSLSCQNYSSESSNTQYSWRGIFFFFFYQTDV